MDYGWWGGGGVNIYLCTWSKLLLFNIYSFIVKDFVDFPVFGKYCGASVEEK